MKKLLFLFFIFYSIIASAQIKEVHNNGTKIINNLSWSEIKNKAKVEQKYILIDCGTTWCGPCKYLEHRLFPLDTIGKLLNDKFLVVSVQFDTSNNDNEFVKSWYQIASEFKRQYNISSYPTEIILDKNANAITKFTGVDSYDGISYLYDQINACFEPENQYFLLKKSLISEAKISSEKLKELAIASNFSSELEDFQYYRDLYLNSLTGQKKFTKSNYEFIVDNIFGTKDSLFDFVFQHYKEIDSVCETPIAREKLSNIIYYEELKWKKIFKNAGSISDLHYIYVEEPNWATIAEAINPKFASLKYDILFNAKLDFYNLEGLNDRYLNLILDKLDANKPITQSFTAKQILTFVNKILLKKEGDKFWLLKGQDWINSLRNDMNNNKIQRYQDALKNKLSSIKDRS